jgi:hypothetical protein
MSRRRRKCESEIGGLVESSPFRVLARGIDRIDRNLHSLLSCQEGVTEPMPKEKRASISFALTQEEKESIQRGIEALLGVEDLSPSSCDDDAAAACVLRVLLDRIGSA